MSVRSETYIIYGTKLDFEKTSEILDEGAAIEFHCRGEEAKGKIGVLFDGMNGEYALAGYCIECGQEDAGISLTNLTKRLKESEFDHLDSQILQFIGSNKLSIIDSKPSDDFLFDVFIVTHYH